MPEHVRQSGSLLSRLELLEEKLDETVLAFCEDREGEALAQWEKTARTIAALLRESERLEEMKKKHENAARPDDRYGQHDPAEIERMRAQIKRKLDRIAAAATQGQVAERADAGSGVREDP